MPNNVLRWDVFLFGHGEEGKLKIHNINKILSLIYSSRETLELMCVFIHIGLSRVTMEADVENILGSF
jgi:hypothetical protein